MRSKHRIAAAALAVGLFGAAPAANVFAQDRGDDDKSVIDDLEETLRNLPKRVEDVLRDVKKELDPERARELKRRLERTIEELKDAIDPRTEKVRVHVAGRTMEVPAQKGKARLY